ncbi:histidinol dehydrogenase [Flavobacterium oreochromis]|uniref:Histidinol dehydrogenase n=2 Tax=Flavobacterium TaxID=237 RepID=A0A246G7V0_9FLAO|nr:histidinol dehydrogenase [Flavobacterium oreochromis]OWP74684.1 histidinol dehydrogenase [Flavobacterium oreochromis]OWP74698.1 histidinol dehydrogenase [Flavobacterium oreochromis]
MEIIVNPHKKEWTQLIQRPNIDQTNLSETINQIFSEIKKEGDKAVIKYTHFFDHVDLEKLEIDSIIWNKSIENISEELKEAIQIAKSNIEKFHRAQIEKKQVIETTIGVKCWRENRPIEKIGIYIPGGSAPLFSTVLMLGIPAKLAGCKEIILCTPPDKNGIINPAILFAARLVGVTRIFTVGGIQAIGAMTFGTRSIPKVDKIFGPGNQYVTAAKQVAMNFGVAIDMPAGPSELLIIADNSSYPHFVAADLLSQAEHGPDSQVILLSDNLEIIKQILEQVRVQIQILPRNTIAQKALQNSKAIVLKDIWECLELSNLYAPEHLILAVQTYNQYLSDICNAGSVFLGNYSCESAGDYASGTNHTLPTNGYARNYSGVSVDSFIKKITFQELSKEGIQNIGPIIEVMAEEEQLFAHKNAVTIRLKNLES